MINIFFVPGMFGSTIEHMIRCYTEEFVPTEAGVAEDGENGCLIKYELSRPTHSIKI